MGKPPRRQALVRRPSLAGTLWVEWLGWLGCVSAQATALLAQIFPALSPAVRTDAFVTAGGDVQLAASALLLVGTPVCAALPTAAPGLGSTLPHLRSVRFVAAL